MSLELSTDIQQEDAMAFVRFMQSWAGRLLRIGVGALMMWYGLTQMAGTGGIALAVVGAVPIAAGVFNFCLLGPLFGVTLMGRPSQ
jgi:hypothetical protein